MGRLSFSAVQLVALCVFGILAMGVDSCTEPQEFCKFYPAKKDQAECTSFCEDNHDFKAGQTRSELVRACQLGQMSRLASGTTAVGDVLLGCDRKFTTMTELVSACRAGVTAEELRIARSKPGHGTANDRETGNGH